MIVLASNLHIKCQGLQQILRSDQRMQSPPQSQLYIPLMSQLIMMRSNCSPSKLNVSESCSSDWSPQAAARQSHRLSALREGVLLVVGLLGLPIIGVLVVVGGAVCTCTLAIVSDVSGLTRELPIASHRRLPPSCTQGEVKSGQWADSTTKVTGANLLPSSCRASGRHQRSRPGSLPAQRGEHA